MLQSAGMSPATPHHLGSEQLYQRYCRALEGEPLPAAFIDLDAVDDNINQLLAPVRAAGKTVRIATKSLRCPDLVDYLVARGAGVIAGVMTYTAAETTFLAARGHRDLLLAYPTMSARDLAMVATANRTANAAIVVDCKAHVAAVASAASHTGVVIPVVIDVDMSYRPTARGPHVGVRRSPIRSADEVVALAEEIAAHASLRFAGLQCYEAQIAGLGDNLPRSWASNAVKRALKSTSGKDILRLRLACVDALRARGLPPILVNGGGSGSVSFSSTDPTLTEISVGSGFLCSVLFDQYRDLSLTPAAGFALQVSRNPAPGIYTCLGGGYIASGAAGVDRLPVPWLPRGLELLAMEGAGEVQTPLRVAKNVELSRGGPVLFRHAKSGELAEHVTEYLFVRGDTIVARAPTYRGLGHCFLG